MADTSKILELARKLNLQNIAHGYIELEEKPDMSNLDYLALILSQEVEMREEKAFVKREKESKLPYREFIKAKVNDGIAWQIDRLETMQWLEDVQNLIIIGKCDTGKTALASHLGRKALENGERVSYMTISRLLEKLDRKDRVDKFNRLFRQMTQSSLIIIDDMMYTRIPDDELPRLYYALNFLNETRSIVIITNRELSSWAEGTQDGHMVETLIARLTAGSQIISLT
ncbi:MAG: ATP-binding protein [Clostridia bacterium]|nr:ATP-binding protein [Clostridia bacterium]